MDISLVIPVDGRYTYLQRSLASILCQPSLRAALGAEIIVVDNSRSVESTEATRTTCMRVLEQFPQARIDFRYVPGRHSNPKHQNGGYTRNVGLQLATAPVVLFSDADILHVTPTIEQHVNHHRDGKSRLVYPFMRDCPSNLRLVEDAFESALADRSFPLRMAAHTNWFGAMSFSGTREHLLDAGGFAESFLWGWFEDYDLARRMRLLGTTVLRDGAIKTLHQVHPRRWKGYWFMKGYAGLRQLCRIKKANVHGCWGVPSEAPTTMRSVH